MALRFFRVRWRWAPGASELTRRHTRLAIGGWLSGIGFGTFRFRERGPLQSLYVQGDEDLNSSARAIHSFVVQVVRPGEHDGPIRSGLATGDRRRRDRIDPSDPRLA